MGYAKPKHTIGIHLRSVDRENLPAEVKVTYFEGGNNTNGEWFTLDIAGVAFFVSRDQLAQIANDVQTAVVNALDPQEVEV